MFMLHPQLAADTVTVGDFPICRVLLNKQFSQFPWLILVPKRTGCRDLTDVAELDYLPVMEEVRAVELALKELTGADKMNVAALGNMVPQLHIHVIARFKDDAAWPKPVWGNAEPQPYDEEALEKMVVTLREVLDVTEASE
jgi:diadenosine tetraphosphate (Ap4A) HIT family hydrolase